MSVLMNNEKYKGEVKAWEQRTIKAISQAIGVLSKIPELKLTYKVCYARYKSCETPNIKNP